MYLAELEHHIAFEVSVADLVPKMKRRTNKSDVNNIFFFK